MNPSGIRRIAITAAPLFLITFSLDAQIGGAPAATEPVPINTEASSLIATGSGYMAWTGSVVRHVVDFEVPGAISQHGLRWERTYNSSTGLWSFAYTWQLFNRPYYNRLNAIYPDGRQSHFEVGSKERYFLTPGDPNDPNNLPGVDLYLEDGSVVHFDRQVEDLSQPDHVPPISEFVDYYRPRWVKDRYGRQTTLTWQDYGTNTDFHWMRLAQIKDEASQRSITITYPDSNTNFPNRVSGSDGHWVTYTSIPNPNGGPNSLRVDYSDGTFAQYDYAVVPWGLHSDASWTVITRARDNRATSPMQSIAYDYNPNGRFAGQVSAERHLKSDGSEGTVVSSLTSQADDTTSSAVQTETRGDNRTRTMTMNKLNGGDGPPFVTSKSLYNDPNHTMQFGYNSNLRYYLNSVTDYRGNTTERTRMMSITGSQLFKHRRPLTA